MTSPALPEQRTSPLHSPTGQAVGVVHLVAELAPYARTGGLGEAVASLASFQAASGLPTATVMPLYGTIRERHRDLQLVPVGEPYTVTVGWHIQQAQLYTLARHPRGRRTARGARGPHGRFRATPPAPRVYFVANDHYFGSRRGIYGEHGGDYPDNPRRFAFFALATLTGLPRIARTPLVLHAHDWQTAMALIYLRDRQGHLFQLDPQYSAISTVLTVHNAGYQGHYPPETLDDIGIPRALFDWRIMEWWGKANFLKGGMSFADAVTTVSPNHARELQTVGGGFGLDAHFQHVADRFSGIVNGIDLDEWDPARDHHIVARYDDDALEGKAQCKVALQRTWELDERPQVPVFGMAARLVQQKGIDLILAAADAIGSTDAQFVFLGRGDDWYEHRMRELAARFPRNVRVDHGFTEVKEHILIAGADLCLMPCQYEPCGLTQMRAQRYGTLPLVRRVGGLADTVQDERTGFVFDAYDPDAMVFAIRRAVAAYPDRTRWERMMRLAMQQDFSWERSEEQYLEVYRRVLERALRRATRRAGG